MTALAIAIAALFLALVAAAPTTKAWAHSWYDYDCCHKDDCDPYPESDLVEDAEGVTVLSTGERLERGDRRLRIGKNEFYHLCRHRTTGALLCIYLPLRGV